MGKQQALFDVEKPTTPGKYQHKENTSNEIDASLCLEKTMKR